MTLRTLLQKYTGIETLDGDGVKLTRIIGSPQLDMLDPFLLLDCFESDDSKDYIGGFPTHPHRGFETVTYMLNGRMRHKDSVGNEGVIESGGMQWMTAAKGILHSEIPEQQEGLMKGFQLWINLPAVHKMDEPTYQEFSSESIPIEQQDNGTKIRIIAGKTNQGTLGAVKNEFTDPIYMDIHLPKDTTFNQTLPLEHNAFIYVIEGSISIFSSNNECKIINNKELAVLEIGTELEVKSYNTKSRFLLVAAKPLNEPVARGGPFVMNTKEELLQAFSEFKKGIF